MMERAVLGDTPGGKGLMQRVQPGVHPRPGFAHCGPECGIFARREAASDAEIEAPAGELVQHADALGYAQRMVIGQRDHTQAQAQLPRALTGRSQDQVRRGAVGELRHQMVFYQPGCGEAEAVGQLPEAQGVFQYLRLRGVQEFRDRELVEEVEAHGVTVPRRRARYKQRTWRQRSTGKRV